MNLTPLNAVAVTPGAWDVRAAKRRQAERIGGIQSVVIAIMSRLETLRRKGQTPENLAPIVAAWAGPHAGHVRIEAAKRVRVGQKRTLILRADNPLYIMELRPRLPALRALVKPTGIEEVSLR